MGSVFQKLVPVFNRAPVSISVRFDGSEDTIPPGEYQIPEQTIYFAFNQNPIMGTQDPHNPHMSGARYLIVVKPGIGYDPAYCEGYGVPMTKEEWEEHCNRPCRDDEQIAFQEKYGQDPGAKLVTLGKGRKSTAQSRYEAGGTPAGNAEFTGKQ